MSADGSLALEEAPSARPHRLVEPASEMPLTPTQHAMLVHSLRAGAPGVELEQLVVHLPEAVDEPRLRAAWAWGVARFEALRTAFVWADGDARQRVLESAEMPFERIDLRGDPEPDARLARFLEADRARGVDLSRAPGARVALITRGERDHTMVWTFHHALLDGRSFTRVLREVMARYDEGDSFDPPGPPSVRAHCERLAARDLEADRAFWTAQLRGLAEPTPLPATRASGEPLGARHLELEARVSATLVERLIELGRRHGFTLADAVQAAWAMVLSRHAREDDVCFGSTRAGRHGTVPDALEAVSCLIHTVPVRVDVEPQREVLAVLRDLRALGLALRAHEHAPLVAMREWAGLPASAPLFESVVVFERYLVDRALRALGGAWSSRRVTVREQSEPPLVLAAYQDEGELILKLEHDPARFDAEGIARVRDHVVAMLREIAARPEARVGELVMTSDDERRALLALAGGDGALAPCEHRTLPEAIAAAARRAPEALALVSDGERLTHDALDEAAGVLAARLFEAGVREGDVVAVSVRRGAPLATALLGVLRAGAVYLPIDPAWPRERIAMVLDDARAVRVITDAHTRVAFDAFPRLGLDAPSALPPRAPAPLDPEAPATLIYTSGSTGRPKGVLVPHRALLAHARAIVPAYQLDARDRCLQFTSPSFDVSLEEMLPTWLAGGSVVPRTEAAATSIDTFLAEVERHAVTVLNLPSAFFTELALHLRDHARALPPAVRLVVVGGERPSAHAYAIWRARHPHVRFVNAYGPTEVTITSTLHDATGVDARAELPIGRPLGACRAYVLDAAGQLAPRGAIGELALAGPQVALGYHARPELTASRFAPDPFAGEGTLMRTGDLARWRDDGALEIFGRADEQLKIRGFRIEPGEIEAVLRADARVRDVVVGARPDAGGAQRLIAWVVLAGPVTPSELRARCEAALPASMIPSSFVSLASLPITPSGKVDRRALPAPDPTRAASAAASDPPRGELEVWIAAVFCELLGLREVGAEQSFFELGGHSLLAVRLLSRLSARGPIELGAIFRGPTVRALARALEHSTAESDATLVSLNDEAPARTPLFLLCGVQLYAPLGRAMRGDRPVLGGFLPCEASLLAVREGTPLDVHAMAPAYLARIRAQQPRGPYLIGGVSFGGVVAYEVAQRLRAEGEEVALLVLFDTILPRGLHRAGLLGRARTHLARLRDPRAFLAHARAALTHRLARRGEELAVPVVRPETLTTEEIDVLRDELFRAAAERYDPLALPYEGPALVFTARHRHVFPGDRVDDDLGWGSLLRGPTTFHPVDGNHLTILREPGASEIARVLRERLDV